MDSLLFATTPEQVRDLVAKGRNVNEQFDRGPTPLYMAFLNKRFSVAAELIRNGAVPEDNMIYTAVFDDRVDILEEFLKQGNSPNPFCQGHSTRFFMWGEKENIFTRACEKGYFDIIDCLFKYGLDINQIDYNEGLTHCCRNGYDILVQKLISLGAITTVFDMVSAINNNHLNIIDILMFNGFNANSTIYGYSMLMYSIVMGRNEAAERLLNYSLDINFIDDNGNTALFLTNDKRMIDLLIANGCDPEIRNSSGERYCD